MRELCRKHIPSLSAFKFPTGASFALFSDDVERTEQLRHLTTTATCIESLRDCHVTCIPKGALNSIAASVRIGEKELKNLSAVGAALAVTDALKKEFYSGAMKRKSWVSEGSAPIYCASRSMPLFLEGTRNWTKKHSVLIEAICRQLRQDAERFGIGEQKEGGAIGWYPENAYHSYWALRVFTQIRRSPFEPMLDLDLKRFIAGLRLWARMKLAEEVGLHWAQSAALDSDQLTWALAAFIQFGDDISSNLRDQDLIRKAFEALGSTQEKIGTWRHYRPLFVYSNVGNAYCYVYESLTYLLKALLAKVEQQEFLEDVIRGFVDRLRRLREYTEMTQVQNGLDHDRISWSSGHRPADSKPEGWATASVFSYLQAYRRVLGILTRRDALRALPGSALSRDPKALATLRARGDTWSLPKRTVAEDLITFFVNPVRMRSAQDPSEPDDQPIEEWQARSAILFGPPGASKTTLARLMAASLDWKYVELHSNHFVAEGIQAVQSTADRIFRRLMELDHAVVLFDEPDELVRERDDSPDAFGRFLTTSMLPKLAELWKHRRIIYFIATNHIRYFDAAIVRSERFDLLALTPPPSFARKRAELRKRLGDLSHRSVSITVTKAQIEKQLYALEHASVSREDTKDSPLPKELQLAKFILLRWDQLEELATHVQSHAPKKGPIVVDKLVLSSALERIVDYRLGLLSTYRDYISDSKQARRDFQRKGVFEIKHFPDEAPLPPDTVRSGSSLWYKCEAATCPEQIGPYVVVRTTKPGVLELQKAT